MSLLPPPNPDVDNPAPDVVKSQQSAPALPDTPGELSFLIEPRMLAAGRIHLLGGSPFAGKSTLLAQLLRAFAMGSEFLGLQCRQIPLAEMGIIFTDRLLSDNRQWLRVAGLEGLAAYSLPDDKSLKAIIEGIKNMDSGRRGFELFKHCYMALKTQPKIVAVDVFTTACLGPNLYDQGTVHSNMLLILQFCMEMGVTVLGTCYGLKQKKGISDQYARAVDRIMGAAPLRGSASGLMFLTAPGEDRDANGKPTECHMLHWESRQGEKRIIELARDGSGLFEIRHPEAQVEPQAIRTGKFMVVLEHVPEEGCTRPTLAAKLISAGFSRPQAYRHIADGLSSGVICIDDAQMIRKADFRPV